MRNRKRILVLLMIIALVPTMTACQTKRSAIKERLIEFADACRNLDQDRILDCIDPDISQPIKAGLLIYGASTGEDKDLLLQEIVAELFGENFNAEDLLSQMSIEKVKIKPKRKTAKVFCTLKFKIDGEEFKKKTRIDMIKADDEWYISGIEFLSSHDE